ncbi:MAG: hypothetical protein H0X40_06775 [Chthoniobacterales bacterium]|nr:hypothetical protein [Chthoniobacterales bacterium]
MNTYCFFAHVVLAIDARVLTPPEATANLLIEINDKALMSAIKERHLKVSELTDLQKQELAREIGKAAAVEELKSDPEFRKLPVQRFVDFNLAPTPTYISIRPPSSKISPNGCRVCRLAESEADKLRSKPLPG